MTLGRCSGAVSSARSGDDDQGIFLLHLGPAGAESRLPDFIFGDSKFWGDRVPLCISDPFCLSVCSSLFNFICLSFSTSLTGRYWAVVLDRGRTGEVIMYFRLTSSIWRLF